MGYPAAGKAASLSQVQKPVLGQTAAGEKLMSQPTLLQKAAMLLVIAMLASWAVILYLEHRDMATFERNWNRYVDQLDELASKMSGLHG